jgi:hypothetical protein
MKIIKKNIAYIIIYIVPLVCYSIYFWVMTEIPLGVYYSYYLFSPFPFFRVRLNSEIEIYSRGDSRRDNGGIEISILGLLCNLLLFSIFVFVLTKFKVKSKWKYLGCFAFCIANVIAMLLVSSDTKFLDTFFTMI